VLFTEYRDVAATAVHQEFAAGRYRDWSWSDVWTDVSRCASDTFTTIAAACTRGWRGPSHRPRDSALDTCRWEWVFLHAVTLSPASTDDHTALTVEHATAPPILTGSCSDG